MRIVVDGDDYTALGSDEMLDWLRWRIADKFEVKIRGRLGPGTSDQNTQNCIPTDTDAANLKKRQFLHCNIILPSLPNIFQIM